MFFILNQQGRNINEILYDLFPTSPLSNVPTLRQRIRFIREHYYKKAGEVATFTFTNSFNVKLNDTQLRDNISRRKHLEMLNTQLPKQCWNRNLENSNYHNLKNITRPNKQPVFDLQIRKRVTLNRLRTSHGGSRICLSQQFF